MSLNNEPQMDRNYWLAIGLSMVVMTTYSFWWQKNMASQKPLQTADETVSTVTETVKQSAQETLQNAPGPFFHFPRSGCPPPL